METITEIANDIYRVLGKSRSEAVYHKAFQIGLQAQNVKYNTEVPILIKYLEQTVGVERVDLIVESSIVIELKAIKRLREEDRDQIRKYLKNLNLDRGLLINFGGDSLEIERH